MTVATTRTRRDIAYRGFRLPADLDAGTAEGVRPTDRGLVLADPAGRLDHTDPHTGRTDRYEWGSWTSPPVPAGFPVADLVPSWTADTPPGCWIQVDLRGRRAAGSATGWYVLGRWTADEETLHRTSVPGQHDATARVDADTLVLTDAEVTGWQVRVTLLRRDGTAASPLLRTVGAVATGHGAAADGGDDAVADGAGDDAVADGAGDDAAGGPARGVVLDVPRYSQRRHAGHHPRWGGGGDSWCSPTCTTMVLAHWGVAPGPAAYAWVEPPGPRPAVVHAVRQTWDHAYAGAGNWPFNTAWAGLHGVEAFVTRLRSLAEAEAFVAAGIPLIVSAAFRSGEVPGLDYDTRGHLMVLVGFTATGDPVLNDPYAPDDDAVRRTVDRRRFEAAWQGGSGGISYVVHPAGVPLPPAPEQANW